MPQVESITAVTENPEKVLCRGHGSSNPQAILVIDHPQGDDYKTNYALTGASEYTVKGFMREVGLYFENFYCTSLIKVPPIVTLDSCKGQGGGTKKYQATNQPLVEKYNEILINEINLLEPNLLIPLGELSFNFLTGLSGIRKYRGSVLLSNPLLGNIGLKKQVKVFPILGPYPYLNQDYRMRMISKLDFSRVDKYFRDAQPPENLINVWVCRTPGALRSFIERSYKEEGFLTFDIETFMQIPVCISFCFNGKEACTVPLIDKSIDRDSLALMWMLVARLLKSKIKKGNQNIKYDWKILERWGFEVLNVVSDTMLAAGCIYPEFPKNLGFLTSIYTELPYHKDEGHELDPTKNVQDRFYLYCAKDSLTDWQIQQKQNEEMLEVGVYPVYSNLIKLLPVYRRMEDRGIRIDHEKRDQLTAKYLTLFEIESIKLRTLVGQSNLNPLSSVQMNRLVFEEFKYELGRYVNGTDEESIEWLILNANHQSYLAKDALKMILNCRKLHKVLEILQLMLHPDGRFRCEFNLAGTETGRTSAGKCTDQLLIQMPNNKIKVKNLGHSLQTIGKHGFSIDGVTYGRDVRDMYVPSFGYSFVEADLSGAEARVDRVLSGNFDMEVFTNPGIHKLTGSWLYNCLPTEIKKNVLVDGKDRYHEAKTLRHGAERNLGANRLVMMIARPLNKCKELLETVHRNEPEIRQVYHRSIIQTLQETQCLIMPNGRRRDFFDRVGPEMFNEGFSLYPQAIVSDQTKFQGILPTYSEFLWAELLTEQHDGTLGEVPIGREEEFLVSYKKNIEVGIDFRQGSIKRDYELIIPCESSMGENWGAMKEVEVG